MPGAVTNNNQQQLALSYQKSQNLLSLYRDACHYSAHFNFIRCYGILITESKN